MKIDWNPEVFVERWRHTFPKLRRRLGGLGFSSEDVSDIAQDVALRLLRNRTMGIDGSHFEAIVMRTARWAAADRFRLSRRSLVIEGPGQDEAQGFEADGESAVRIRQALESLSVREKEVLLLSVEGAAQDEIARRLQISPATVRSILRFARSRLMGHLL